MYPFLRMAKEMFVHRNDSPLPLDGTHVSHHMCWPWDLDLWAELNNGRTLTLYDLGRIPMASRTGLIKAIRANGWGLTMAGVSVRYRRRIRIFQKFEIHSKVAGWDDRFVYMVQSIWVTDKKGRHCANQALYRTAVTSAEGIVAPDRVIASMGNGAATPKLPEWVQNWIAAEATRPWPPVE